MIIEGSSVPNGETIDADLCIVGAGPAGLTVASRFLGTNHRVYLLESGGEHPDERTRNLSGGELIGHPYFRLMDAHERALGGSSYIWGEWMRARPLDEIDFESRSWVEGSGWPMERDSLAPFYEQAQKDLGLGPFDYELGAVIDGHLILQRWGRGDVKPIVFRFSNTADFTARRNKIDSSANVCLMLNSTALEVSSDEKGQRAITVTVSSDNPQRFKIRARAFVIACGGIESPRLLLLSRWPDGEAPGNRHDNVGRYFMEHPTVRRGFLEPSTQNDVDSSVFSQRSVGGSEIRIAFAPSNSAMRKHEILNGMVLLTPSTAIETSEVYRSLSLIRSSRQKTSGTPEPIARHAVSVLSHPAELAHVLRGMRSRSESEPVQSLSITVEQAPNRSSRVILGDKRDRFGLAMADLDWRLDGMEHRTVRVLQEALGREMTKRGIGQIQGLLGEESPPRVFRGEWHQMGTTRMSSEARNGVVDSDGKIWGVENLYVAGGSIFPTVGYANPTLTITAMALRLAAHLDGELSSRPSLGPLW